MGIFGNNNNSNIYELGKSQAEDISDNINKSYRILNEIIGEELELIGVLHNNFENKKVLEKLIICKTRKEKCLNMMEKGLIELEKIVIFVKEKKELGEIFSKLVLVLSEVMDKVSIIQQNSSFFFRNVTLTTIGEYHKCLKQQQEELITSQKNYLYAYESTPIGRTIKSVSKMASKFAKTAAIATLAGSVFFMLGSGDEMIESDYSMEMFKNRMICVYVLVGLFGIGKYFYNRKVKKVSF